MNQSWKVCLAAVVASGWIGAQNYIPRNLVSDLPGQAQRIDPNLKNPWGITFAPTGPFWISDQKTGVSTVYNAQGESFPITGPLVVSIPGPGASSMNNPGKPTGIVFHSGSGFEVAPGRPALFIFAGVDGVLSGWNPQVEQRKAILKVDRNGMAAYTGLAIGSSGTNQYLYAANFFAGTVEVFDSNWAPATMSPGAFTDPTVPPGFAPFNVQSIDGNIWVAYALQNGERNEDVRGIGNGYIRVFSPDGMLIKRFASQGKLNSPWAMAVAPVNFGQYSDKLLVGNFGDGRINAYDRQTGEFLGQLNMMNGQPIEIEGLWGLVFGNGNQGAEAGILYYTAGIADEEHGVFGEIRPQ